MSKQSPPRGRLTARLHRLGFTVRVSLINDDVVLTAAHEDGRKYVTRGNYHNFMKLLRDLAKRIGALES
jgi:hypothetical protein